MKNRPTGGFTLLELLIVVAIIALLSTIGLINFRGQSDMAKLRSTELFFKGLGAAIEHYKNDLGEYPPSGSHNLSWALYQGFGTTARQTNFPYFEFGDKHLGLDLDFTNYEHPNFTDGKGNEQEFDFNYLEQIDSRATKPILDFFRYPIIYIRKNDITKVNENDASRNYWLRHWPNGRDPFDKFNTNSETLFDTS